MAEPDENPFGDPTVGHPFQVIFETFILLTVKKKYPNFNVFKNLDDSLFDYINLLY